MWSLIGTVALLGSVWRWFRCGGLLNNRILANHRLLTVNSQPMSCSREEKLLEWLIIQRTYLEHRCQEVIWVERSSDRSIQRRDPRADAEFDCLYVLSETPNDEPTTRYIHYTQAKAVQSKADQNAFCCCLLRHGAVLERIRSPRRSSRFDGIVEEICWRPREDSCEYLKTWDRILWLLRGWRVWHWLVESNRRVIHRIDNDIDRVSQPHIRWNQLKIDSALTIMGWISNRNVIWRNSKSNIVAHRFLWAPKYHDDLTNTERMNACFANDWIVD